MRAHSNGLTIGALGFSASGSIVGTHQADAVSASSSSAAGDVVKFEFNMGEDSVTDVAYKNGAGKELVKIYNFDQTATTLGHKCKLVLMPLLLGQLNEALLVEHSGLRYQPQISLQVAQQQHSPIMGIYRRCTAEMH